MESISELRKIYGYLSDEESREIFKLRMEYLITGDYHPIETICQKYLPTLQSGPLYSVDEIIKMSGERHIVCYGAGGDASFYADYWKGFEQGKIVAFCDRSEVLQKTGFLGFNVISPDQLKNKYGNAFVVITSSMYGEDIKEDLLSEGFSEDQIVSRIFPPLSGVENQYFDSNIVKFDGNGEVYVDGGSMDLSSVKRLLQITAVKKVYAFEPNRDHYERCEAVKQELGLDIDLFRLGLWSKKEELRFTPRSDGGSNFNENGVEVVNVCSLEDIVGAGRISFIKMDIEGAELEALKGCRNIIKRDKPILTICIYHKPEDMYEIPMYIKGLVPEYKLFVRHYSNRQFETVLYAVM